MCRFSDIWGGFDEQLLVASERYEADSVLVGRIRPDSNQRNRWNYYFADDELIWNGEPELVLGLVADQLADEFAISGDAPLEYVDLNVSGIDSVEAYGEIQNLLASTNVIESFAISEVVRGPDPFPGRGGGRPRPIAQGIAVQWPDRAKWVRRRPNSDRVTGFNIECVVRVFLRT